MPNNGLDISELLDYGDEIKKVIREDMPKELNKFMREQGNNLKNEVLRQADAKVKKKNGRYRESIKRGKVYVYKGNGGKAVRAYSTARHAHLIENGYKYKLPNGKEGYVNGKYVFDTALKNYKPTFYRDTENFVEECVKKLGE